jgi:hypothetical protein
MLTRCGNKWTINEILSLQREWELLELTIHQIAERHQRTPEAIVFKLAGEKFATNEEMMARFGAKKKSHRKTQY